jgi:hypothetical protein
MANKKGFYALYFPEDLKYGLWEKAKTKKVSGNGDTKLVHVVYRKKTYEAVVLFEGDKKAEKSF